MNGKRLRYLATVLLWVLVVCISAAPVKITQTYYWRSAANTNERSGLAAWTAWQNETDPLTGRQWRDEIELAGSSSLNIEGSSVQLLKFAAGSGEDVIWSHPDSFYLFRDQDLFLPLNCFIWEVRADAKGMPIRKPDGSWNYVLDAKAQRKLRYKD